MRLRFISVLMSVAGTMLCLGCSAPSKIELVKERGLSPQLSLPSDKDRRLVLESARPSSSFTDEQGRERYVMDAILDEQTGEMVANETLNAAVLVARFRNVAERMGVIDMEFLIVVSDTLQDPSWQLRLDPFAVVLGDTLRLDPVFITGEDFRKAQIRGYEKYAKYLGSLSRDSTRFVDQAQANLFLSRGSSLSESEVQEHYSRHLLKRRNRKRVLRKDEVRRKYIKAPIDPDFARIDSVCAGEQAFLYIYNFSLPTRAGLRRIDVSLDGALYDRDRLICTLPQSEEVSFYVSSLSSMVDSSMHFKKVVVFRNVKDNITGKLDFALGSSRIDSTLGRNGEEIAVLQGKMQEIAGNDELALDSLVVSASCSPEGRCALNSALSSKRSAAAREYFGLEGARVKGIAENWEMLDSLVRDADFLTERQKKRYFYTGRYRDPDIREGKLRHEKFYPELRDSLYPQLRHVSFTYYLHRKAQLKDTIVTDIPDTAYMRGVSLLKERRYEAALAILSEYRDYNTALALLSLDCNATAAQILETLPPEANVLYSLALSYSRRGREADAVKALVEAVEKEPAYKYRGNLDPEIAAIIRKYRLFEEP